MDKTLQSYVNTLFQQKLPALNNRLQIGLKNRSLDPWDHVCILGGEIGGAATPVHAKISIADLVGLSTFSLQQISVGTLKTSNDTNTTYSGTLNFNGKVATELHAQIKGQVETQFGFEHSGSPVQGMLMSQLTAEGSGKFSVTLQGNIPTLDKFSIDQAPIKLPQLQVQTNIVLGFLSSCNESLDKMIVEQFSARSAQVLSNIIVSTLEESMQLLLPITESTSQLKDSNSK